MEEVVERLVQVQELADDAGYGDLVGFDFGLLPELDYYTGIVIEAYAPGVDFPVGSGGRYDRLLAAFDWPIPAVGFTIDLDRLHEALVDEGAGVASVAPPPLSFCGGLDDPRHVLELRRHGVAVPPCPTTPRRPFPVCARSPASSCSRRSPARPVAPGATCCAPSGSGEAAR